MKLTAKELAVQAFTLALTYNAQEVKTQLPVAEAILVYEQVKETLLTSTNLLVNQYKRVYSTPAFDGSIITTFEF